MAVTRFMRKGTSQFYFVPAVANLNAPTVAEMTAGDELTPQISTINGLEFSNVPIPVPDMAATFTSQIPGEDQAADTSFEFYELMGGTDDIHDALVKGTAGFLVVFPAGTATGTPAASDKCEVWPCVVAANSRLYTADNEAGKYRVNFSMTAPPDQSSTVAA